MYICILRPVVWSVELHLCTVLLPRVLRHASWDHGPGQRREALRMFIVLGLHHGRRDVLPVYTDMGHALLILVQIMRVHA